MNNKIRYLLSMTLAVIISLVVSCFFSYANFFLIPLSALFIMQTSVGNLLFQSMQRVILLLVIVTVCALLLKSMPFFYITAHDVGIGAVIGILANILILPRRADSSFREAAIPVIQTFQRYFSELLDALLQNKSVSNEQLEKALLNLPGWVYERGFDIGLQKGQRFFLVKLEQVSDVLFSLHHLVRHPYDRELIAKMREPLLNCVEHFDQVFSALITVLNLKKLTEGLEDFSQELTELENLYRKIVPYDPDLLDFKRDYVYFAEFIYNLKDLRKALLKLAEALR